MIFLIKDMDYFQELLNKSTNVFHLTNKNVISIKNLYDIIENNLYKNIFLDMPIHLNFFKDINLNKFPHVNVHIFISNLNYIPVSLLIKSKIIMEKKDYYCKYYSEIEKFLNNKNYIIHIPQELQLGVLRAYLINIMEKIKNKDFLKNFLNEINNIFFYNDRKTQFQILYILNEEMKFADNNI